MSLLERSIELVPDRLGTLRTWLPRIAIALVFVSVGSSKFTDPMWVRLFGQIGLGQWFRYLTGVMQIAGGLLHFGVLAHEAPQLRQGQLLSRIGTIY